MAIARYSPDTLTGIIRSDLQDPYGGFVAANPVTVNTQYNYINLPDRLRGIGIERYVKSVTQVISELVYNQVGNDQGWRDHIKQTMASQFAQEAMQVAEFKQIRDPNNYDVKVTGRVVIMTIDQLNYLINKAR